MVTHTHQDNRLDNVPEYEYEPLAENGSEIRVLSILPGNQADAIQIQLSTIVFDADSADKLPYEALSYTWGSPRDPAKVFITGENGLRSLAVTQNCHEALQNLRYSDDARTVWIDAICINQRDLKERAQQVSIMRSVYGKAAGVIVWLGPSANDSDRAIEWIETIGKAFEWHHGAVVYRDPELPLSVSDRLLQASYIVLEAFTDLLERPYFDRLWVWQEVQMGGDATTVRCGNSETTFQSLMTAVHFCGQNVHDDTPTIERFFARVDYIQNLPLNGTFDSLIALDRLRECQCADQRDRIYTAPAFGDVHSGPYMMPDYECSIQAVYVDFILRYLHENRGLGFLTHVGKSVLPTEATGQTGMPSWVPDWSQSKVAEPFIFGVCCGFSEASLVSVDRAQLTVQGVKVGTIHKSAMFGYHNLAIYTYLDICRTLQSLVPSNIDEVFLHRLVRVLTSSMYAEHCMSSMSVYATMDQCSRYLRQALEKHDVFSLDPSKIVLRDRELISTQRQFYVCRGRSLFTTMDDQVGLGPRDVREGDILVTVLGCEYAMVLRSNEVDPSRHHVIGTAVCTHIMDAEPLLGQLPSEFESVVVQQESTGVYSPAFKNKLDGSITYEDPRLPPLSPEWETLSKDDSERYFAACPLAFRNKSTGDVRQYWRDPRMDADALEGRGVKIEDFKLV